MKNIWKILIICMSFLLVGCDETDESAENSILGKWQGTFQSTNSSDVETHKVTLTFKDDGRFELLNEDADIESEGLYESFVSLKKDYIFL